MLSVVITAWNEEKNLPRAVASVKDLADEIIVVDTESTDKTVVVARELGCRVFHHPNTRIVEPVRNFSISKASGDWILLLDADEEVTPSLGAEITKIIASDNYAYCRIPRKNLIFGRWIKSSHWWPDYVYRLFKKGAVTWQEKIHSIPLTTGAGYDFPLEEKFSLVHHNYESVSQYVDRLNRYSDVQSANLLSTAYRFTWMDLILKPGAEFTSQLFSRKGYLEGVHGLALALLQAFSELVVYLKVWQASGFAQHEISGSIDKPLLSLGRDLRWWILERRIRSTSGLTKVYWRLRRALPI